METKLTSGKKALTRATFLLALLSGGAALAQPASATQPAGPSTTGGILPLVSVGNTWPQAQESYEIEVTAANAGKPLNLEVYSPTTNLADYADFTGKRQRGPNYFGDEIYSKEKTFQTTFILTGPGGTVVSRTYDTNREHTWDSLFSGGLPAGTYTLKVTSKGNGKNSFALRVAAPFALETSDFSVNARSTDTNPLLAARLGISADLVGKTVSLINYDVDGPTEAETWLVLPGNVRRNLPTSGNGKSATEKIVVTREMVGEWQVYIRVLPTTQQFSNAIRYSFRIGDRPTQATVGGFDTPKNVVIANRLVVDVVDTEGKPIPGASYVLVGDNTVKPTLPQGYTPVSAGVVEGKGNVVSPTEVRFQPGNNRVRFVARRPAPPAPQANRLLVDVVDTEGNPIPGASFNVSGNTVKPVLPQGYTPVSSGVVSGKGTVVSPTEVRFQSGIDNRIRFVARRPAPPAPVTNRLVVDVVDTQGNPIPGATYDVEGNTVRPTLPQGYTPVSANILEGRGNVVSPTEITFQNGIDNTLRFVARRPNVIVEVVDPTGKPIPGASSTAEGGVARPILPQGYVPVSCAVLEGQGTVVSPTEVRYQPGDARIRCVARLPRILVDVVDTEGRPVPGSDYTAQNGVARPTLPAGWVPVSGNLLEGRGTVASPSEVRYQPNEDTTIRFVARQQRILVDVVDTQGNPIPGAEYTVQGNIARPTLPQGWVPVSANILEGQGNVPSPTEVQFQPGDTRIRFVARQAQGGLTVDAVAIYGDRRIPLTGVPFQVNGQTLNTPASLPLNPGEYPVTPTPLTDSTFTAPQPGRVVDGQTARVTIEYNVQTSLGVAISPDVLGPGQTAQLAVSAKTNFPYALPANITLNLPNGWNTDYPRQLSGNIGGGAVLALKAPVTVNRSGTVTASLAPTSITTSAQATVRAPGGANASRVQENGPQATLAKTIEPNPNGQGYNVTLVLTVTGTVDNLVIVDALPQGALRNNLGVTGAGNVSPSTQGDNIVLGRVTSGTYRINYSLLSDLSADRLLTVPEIHW